MNKWMSEIELLYKVAPVIDQRVEANNPPDASTSVTLKWSEAFDESNASRSKPSFRMHNYRSLRAYLTQYINDIMLNRSFYQDHLDAESP